MQKLIYYIRHIYEAWGITDASLTPITTLTVVFISIMLMYIVYWILNEYVEPLIDKITYKTEVKWDDIVFRHKALRWIWRLFPMIIGDRMIPKALEAYPHLSKAAMVMFEIALVLVVMMIVIENIKSVFLLIADRDNIEEIAEKMHEARVNGEEYVYKPSHSLKGLQQMMSILVIAIAVILCISIIFGKDPLIVVSGLGAAAAIIMLVFQDSILGVVAGVQLTANDMLQPGDWIIAPKYQANGIVQEVTLAAVKVQNWDKTIVTIPPYHLLSEGFQNWRGMLLSKGRRIMRSINIDMNTVRFVTPDEEALWSEAPWWRPASGDGKGDDRVVNLSAFRYYLEYFITTEPTMRHNMLYMIRELQPTPEGLPIEIYFFTAKTDWKSYEMVQADVIDRILAAVPEFGLRVFQRPTGYDVRQRGQA